MLTGTEFESGFHFSVLSCIDENTCLKTRVYAKIDDFESGFIFSFLVLY